MCSEWQLTLSHRVHPSGKIAKKPTALSKAVQSPRIKLDALCRKLQLSCQWSLRPICSIDRRPSIDKNRQWYGILTIDSGHNQGDALSPRPYYGKRTFTLRTPEQNKLDVEQSLAQFALLWVLEIEEMVNRDEALEKEESRIAGLASLPIGSKGVDEANKVAVGSMTESTSEE